VPEYYDITVGTSGTNPAIADKVFRITVLDVADFVPVETEYTAPGAIVVAKPVGATKLTIECVGAGGPGCIGSALAMMTSYRDAHTHSSLMKSGLTPISADALVGMRGAALPFDVYEPGVWPINAPPECVGYPATYECIGGGGQGFIGGAGGGQYASRTKVVTEAGHLLNIPASHPYDAVPYAPRPSTIFNANSTVTHCMAAGGQAAEDGGWGGGTGINVGDGDVMYTGGRGYVTGVQGGGGSAAWSGGRGNDGIHLVGGASPGPPAGAGGDINSAGNPEGGGGGVAGHSGEGWASITWTYPAPNPTTGGGGGGGAYAAVVDYDVTSLTGVHITVPQPSLTNTRVNGAPAEVRADSSTGALLCSAAGGNHGVSQDVGDGLGGAAAACVGATKFSGGNGSAAVTLGGAGGSAAWSTGNGYNAQGDTGGTDPGGAAGAGGNNGMAGQNYGGGGGSSDTVGNGAGGYIKLSWT
jgi:putative hemolysin